MASIFQRGKRGTWWIKYYVDGKQVYRSLKTTVAREAERVKKLIEGQEASGDLVAPSRTPLPEFLEEFCQFLSTVRTGKSYKNDLSILRMLFGPVCSGLEPGSCTNVRFGSAKRKPVERAAPRVPPIEVRYLEDVTTARIENYLSARIREEGISAKTTNHFRALLHRMFNYAIKTKGFVATDRRQPNPAAAVERRREPAREIRFLRTEDIVEQLDVVRENPTLYAMVSTYIYAGLRREEALWLTPRDVDFERRLMHVRAKEIDDEFWQPKTRRNRVVPVSTILLEVLLAFDAEQPNGRQWFFPSPQGKRWNPDNFSQDLRKLNKAAGLQWGCLDFRHTFGSHLAQKGESLYKIAEIMGNSPGICQKHYAALCPESMHDTVEFGNSKQAKPDGDDDTKALLKQLLARMGDIEAPKATPHRARLRLAR
jgi:integrase